MPSTLAFSMVEWLFEQDSLRQHTNCRENERTRSKILNFQSILR